MDMMKSPAEPVTFDEQLENLFNSVISGWSDGGLDLKVMVKQAKELMATYGYVCMPPPDALVTKTFRIPVGLATYLEGQGREADRSLNAEVVHILKREVGANEKHTDITAVSSGTDDGISPPVYGDEIQGAAGGRTV